jgi:hypothetical protein
MRRPAARSRQPVAEPPAKPRRGRPPKQLPAKTESAEVAVDDEFKEAAKSPAVSSRKPNADEQNGDWSGDKDYEPNE